MTEEQKKQIDGIIKLKTFFIPVVSVYAISINNPIPIYHERMTIELVITLAKVFNKEITKEKAFCIINEIVKNNYYEAYPKIRSSGEIVAYIKNISWAIANYFDKHFDNDNKENENNK